MATSTSKNAETVIKTARLVLRGPRQTDLEAMFGWFGNGRAMRYWSTVPHADRSVTQERLDRQIAGFARRPTYFVIDYDGIAIGNAGMGHDAEVGFILHPEYWRRGFVREAMEAILPHIWRTTDLASAFADVDPDNEASVGLLTSLGFAETRRAEQTYCIDGVWSDSVYLTLMRPAP